jgi:hypothetical protein
MENIQFFQMKIEQTTILCGYGVKNVLYREILFVTEKLQFNYLFQIRETAKKQLQYFVIMRVKYVLCREILFVTAKL